MHKESVGDKQCIAVIVLYIVGTSSLVIFSLEAKKDLWVGILICYLMTMVMGLLIARVKTLFPDLDIFQVFELCFGKVLAKLINVVYILSCFYVSVLINTFLIQFIKTTALPDTPKVVLDIFITLICIWMVKGGVGLISNFATFFLIPTLLSIGMLIIGLFPMMNLDNLLPPFHEKLGAILYGALSTFIFPLGEIVIFSGFFKTFRSAKSPYRVLLIGPSIGALGVLTISVSSVLVLGIKLASDVYYPTYIAASLIMLGTYLHGFELMLSTVFIVGAFVKTNVYFTVCCKALARTFGFQDNYQFLITPIGLSLFAASLFFFDGPLDYTQWLKQDLVPYSIPYLMVIPIITYGVAEFRKRKLAPQFRK